MKFETLHGILDNLYNDGEIRDFSVGFKPVNGKAAIKPAQHSKTLAFNTAISILYEGGGHRVDSISLVWTDGCDYSISLSFYSRNKVSVDKIPNTYIRLLLEKYSMKIDRSRSILNS